MVKIATLHNLTDDTLKRLKNKHNELKGYAEYQGIRFWNINDTINHLIEHE